MATVTTGFTAAAAAAYASGTQHFGNVDNALTSNNTRTDWADPQPTPSDDFISHYLKLTGLSSKVPFDATVTGLDIKIERVATGPAGAGFSCTDEVVALVVGGAVQADNQADTATEIGR